jgi:hypothetical protein
MDKKLRFTGEWPTPKYWGEFPNWDYALEEEGEDDQDETTLKPADIQNYIDECTALTAADAECADGSRLPALIELIYEPSAVNVFIDDKDAWRVVYHRPSKRWEAFIQDWLPESERGPEISMEDPKVFPLVVKSRLRRTPGGEPFHFTIYPDGSSKDFD